MKKVLLAIIVPLILTVEQGYGQITFQKTVGLALSGPNNSSGWYSQIIQTPDSGYLIATEVMDSISTAYGLLIKINSYGDTLWIKKYSNTSFYSIDTAGGGSYIVSGSPSTIKINSSGNTVWSRYSPDTILINSAKQSFDRGYILTGFKPCGPSLAEECFIIIKTDSIGKIIWSIKENDTIYGSSSIGHDVMCTSDSGFIFLGFTSDPITGLEDILIFKTNKTGSILWEKTYGGGIGVSTMGYKIIPTSDSNYIISGQSSSFAVSGSLLLKVDFSGNIIWAKRYDSIYDSYSIRETKDKGFIFLAKSGLNRNNTLVKIDSSGNFIWQKTYKGWTGFDIAQTFDGGYIISGTSNSTVFPIVILKTDSMGNGGCNLLSSNIITVNTTSLIVTNASPQFSTYNPLLNNATIVVSRGIYIDTSCFNNSGILNIQELSILFSISPNPFSTQTTIEINDSRFTNTDFEMQLYDVFGKIVLTSKISNRKSVIERGNLPCGVYFVRALSLNPSPSVGSEVFTAKLIITD